MSSLRGATEEQHPCQPCVSSGTDLFLLSHPWDFLASYHRTLPHECVLYPNGPPIQKSTVARPHSLDLFISPTCPGTDNNPLHCMFVSPERAGERVTEKWRGVTKTKKKNPRKQLHAPPLYEPCASGFPAPESVN